MKRAFLFCAALFACGDGGTSPAPPPPETGARLEVVASGLAAPVFLTAPPGDPRLFVVEQPGRIRIIREGQLLPTPFLDISERVGSGGERGLLSMAFHPSYAATAGSTSITRTAPATRGWSASAWALIPTAPIRRRAS